MNKVIRAKAVQGGVHRHVLLGRATLGEDIWFPGDPRKWHLTMIEWWT